MSAYAFSPAIALAQDATSAPAGDIQRDAIAVQEARNKAVKDRGRQVWYTKKYDLSGLPHYKPGVQVDGTLRIWGNNYLTDGALGDYWQAGFAKYQPGVKITYDMATTAIGLAAVTAGAADLGMSRKPMFLELLAFQRRMGYDPLEIAAVTGSYDVPGWTFAFAMFVNKKNPIAGLSMKQLDGMFGGPRNGGWVGTEWHPEFARGADQNIRTWGQLGLKGEWADKPIHIYMVSMRYNSTSLFSDLVLKSSDKYNENIEDFANFKDGNGRLIAWFDQMKAKLDQDPYGILFSVANQGGPNLKLIPIAPGAGTNYITLNLDNEQNLSYPLALQQYFYANRKPGTALDPKVKEFLRYVLSQEGQEEVERDGKYLPLTASQVTEMLKRLE